MFVARKDLDWPVGALRRFFGDGGFEVFLNAVSTARR
jgi:hypothetical protein